MCRSIVRLQPPAGSDLPGPSDEDVTAAARQFVRKVSGSRTPSKANEAAFEQAIADVAGTVRQLLDHWSVPGQPQKV